MIKSYHSNQIGAPVLCGRPGSLIAVLDACLLHGMNRHGLVWLSSEGDLVSANVGVDHGFKEGDIVCIEGAGDKAYEGARRIHGITPQGFQFNLPVTPQSPVAGPVTVMIAPLGWEKPFSQELKAAYRCRGISADRPFLRIDETPLGGNEDFGRGSQTAIVQMWEQLSDIDNGSGMAQTYWRKAQHDSATPIPWLLVGDDKRFWLCVAWSESYPNRYVPYLFGTFPSFKRSDAFAWVVAGAYDFVYNWNEPSSKHMLDCVFAVGTDVGRSGIFVARSHTQDGGCVPAQWVSAPAYNSGTGMGVTGLPYPNPADGGLYVMPLMLQEQAGPSLRGRLPGLLCPLHGIAATSPQAYEGVVIDGSVRQLLVVPGTQSGGAARYAFDLTGPWD